MLVFPAIDLMNGQAVRLQQGRRDSAKVYSSNPPELARAFATAGAPRLHVVDLDAAFTGGTQNNHETIKAILAATTMEVEVGGGVRTLDACERLFALGARFAVMGTAAIKTPELVAEACRRFPKRIVVAVDAREGKVAVEGWTEDTKSDALEVGLAVAEAGAAAVLYTDIGRDGMRSGPNLEATARLAAEIAPCAVIASGGMARLEDIDQVKTTGAHAVVIGKAIYEGMFTVAEALAPPCWRWCASPRRRSFCHSPWAAAYAAWRMCASYCWPGLTRPASTPPQWPTPSWSAAPPTPLAARPSWLRWTPAIGPTGPATGRSSPTAAANPLTSTRLPGARAWPSLEQEKSC
jgi:phosphoribosylformimino-5-aminoimidazole carboxamide ribotide isomerase